MTTTVSIKERNEIKYLHAIGLNAIPSPRDRYSIDFEFQDTLELTEARQAFAMNRPVPVLSFIAASRYIDRLIAEHRERGAK